MSAERWILHADMDAFYASIEQRDHPELANQPVIVGAGSARGVVAAASYEARKFGVRSAMPGFQARKLCPQAVFLPGNMEHYAAVSAEVHEVFLRFTPEIEPLALDEAFLDITGSRALFGAPEQIGRKLREAVFESTRLPVSVGIAPNKLVAKLACTLAKPNGMKIVPPEEITSFLAPLPVRRLWGVGPVLATQLTEAGFMTFADLWHAPEDELRAIVGRRAPALRALARGEDARPVQPDRAPKSYGEENTFEHDVSAVEIITAALTAHAEAVARRVRTDGIRGRTVTLKIKLGRARETRTSRIDHNVSEPVYPLLTRSRTLPHATDSGAELRKIAIRLWHDADIREPVRLLGVSLSNLESLSGLQLELFDRPREDKLGPVMDAIHERFGKAAITRAVQAPGKLTASSRRKHGDK
ncbi:MAG TPA: DNA polymerase IV [Polyangiaceae bacterium]|nr:DNA polymerase IV [Polyangiaceae bacterium]